MQADIRIYPNKFSTKIDVLIRHYHRYIDAIKILNKYGIGEKWLDFGCGCGYGTNFLSNFTDYIDGYDIDTDTLKYAITNYLRENINFTPTLSKKYDVIFAIEIIEHVTENELKKLFTLFNSILKNNGIVICTTPIVMETNYHPVNKHHKIEYSINHFFKKIEESDYRILDYILYDSQFTDGENKKQGIFKLCRQNS